MAVTVHHGDSREVLRGLPDASVDAVCTDPPYALVSIQKRFGKAGAAPAKSEGASGVYKRASAGFMGQSWDVGDTAFCEQFWAEVYRVLKPGGHVVAFSATRTYHRLACAIEDAGFEIRDMVAWLYGSGFPKSHDVSKGIDRLKDWSLVERLSAEIKRARAEAGLSLAQIGQNMLAATEGQYGAWYHRGGHMFFETGRSLPSRPEWERLRDVLPVAPEFVAVYDAAEREITGTADEWTNRSNYALTSKDGFRRDKPASDLARQWEGWGTALKPSQEPLVWAQKPHTNQQQWVTINAHLEGVEAALWSMLSASAAERLSASNPSGFGGGSSSAQWSVADALSTPDVSCALTATSPSEWATVSSWSTVCSWRRILAALSGLESTSTTETGSSTTTDWRTLSSCLSKLTPESITQAHSRGAWSIAHASPAVALFNACVASSRATLELSAAASAIGNWPPSSQDEDAPRPFLEPIVLARKPIAERNVAANVLKHGTGALNIDGCRVACDDKTPFPVGATSADGSIKTGLHSKPRAGDGSPSGRWPANVVHDGSDEVVGAFPADAKGGSAVSGSEPSAVTNGIYGEFGGRVSSPARADTGSAARFFYSAKADAEDRLGSKHPTVKPVDLMRWLTRLVTPPGGTVLDPFAGTGSTGLACMAEGFDCILIEREEQYVADINRRLAWARGEGRLTAQEKARQAQKAVDDLPLFGGEAA